MKNAITVILIIMALLGAVYGIAQETAAKKALELAEKNSVLAEAARKEADANAAEAKNQAEIAKISQMAAVIAKQQAEQAMTDLARCKGKK